VFSVLIGVGFIGLFFLMALRPAQDTRVVNGNDNGADDDELASSVSNSVITVFKGSVNLFFTREMLLLSLTFFYTGKWRRGREEWWTHFHSLCPQLNVVVVVLYLIAPLIGAEIAI